MLCFVTVFSGLNRSNQLCIGTSFCGNAPIIMSEMLTICWNWSFTRECQSSFFYYKEYIYIYFVIAQVILIPD